MITVNNMFQAHEIAQAANAYIYRLANGYLITLNPCSSYPFVASFK